MPSGQHPCPADLVHSLPLTLNVAALNAISPSEGGRRKATRSNRMPRRLRVRVPTSTNQAINPTHVSVRGDQKKEKCKATLSLIIITITHLFMLKTQVSMLSSVTYVMKMTAGKQNIHIICDLRSHNYLKLSIYPGFKRL